MALKHTNLEQMWWRGVRFGRLKRQYRTPCATKHLDDENLGNIRSWVRFLRPERTFRAWVSKKASVTNIRERIYVAPKELLYQVMRWRGSELWRYKEEVKVQ